MSKKTIHIIPHTHWDKEWYFTSSRSKVYLMRQIQEIVKVLIEDPNYQSFLLDGQTSLLEDYLRYYPEDELLIKELVRKQRLLIGPWYTQTDQSVVAAESIVRNLYYGMKGAENLGHGMKVAYCPDVFGQGGNMPQIYRHFDIDSFLFWRGISDDRLKQLEFNWQGSDGSQVLAVQLYFAYYYGLNIPENKGTISTYIESVIPPLEKRASVDALYFPSGGDQSPIQRELVDAVKAMNEQDPSRHFVLSTPEAFFKEVKAQVKELPVITGELVEGKNSRIHKSIYSTRADLKQANNHIENKLTNVLEPLLAISHSLGHRYPHRELEEIWKLLFENAAHDSIGGCNSDETNQDINSRYKLAKDMVNNLLDLHMREIAMTVKQEAKYALTIFNTLPYQRAAILEAELYIPEGDFKLVDKNGRELSYTILTKEDQSDYLLNQFAYLTPHLYQQEMSGQYIPDKVYLSRVLIDVPNMPAMGYEQLYLLPDEQSTLATTMAVKNDATIDNEFYQVTFSEEKKAFKVLNKENQECYDNQFVIVNNGDDGDSYNYSPPVADWLLTSLEDSQILTCKTLASPLEQQIEVTFKLAAPTNLEQRNARNKDGSLLIIQRVFLRKNEKRVRVAIEVDNQLKDHRLCLTCDTKIQGKYSIADKLFGVEKAELVHPKMETWQAEGWTEAPISINPMQSFACLTNQTSTVAMMTEGVRQYEIIGEDYSTIQLTLFRCFGHMGKEDLVYRPGRASGEKIVETPDAQLQGQLRFEVAVVYEGATFEDIKLAKSSKEYLTPFSVYELTDFLNGRTIFKKNLPEQQTAPISYSLLDFADSEVILSALKKTELGDNLLFRIFNPYLSKEIELGTVIQEADSPVALDEITLMSKPSSLLHNQFQSFVRKPLKKLF